METGLLFALILRQTIGPLMCGEAREDAKNAPPDTAAPKKKGGKK